MIATDWYPTVKMRWSKEGRLQQEWRRDTTEYRTHNGNPAPRRCDGFQTQWRDVPAESESER